MIEPGLGLHDYLARHYAQPLGRWIAPDTVVPDPADPQSLNRYSYVLNNALRYIDPSGHQAIPAPAAPISQDWAQMWQFVQAVGGLSVSLGPEAALVTVLGVTTVSATVIGTAWAMQDIGPDYQTPSEYVPEAIQASHALPNAGTVSIDTAADPLAFQLDGNTGSGQEQLGVVLPAKINPEGNGGARPWNRPDGQNFNKNPQEDRPKPPVAGDPRTRGLDQPPPVLSPEDILKNLIPDRVGWPRFLLAKAIELIDAVVSGVAQ